MIPNENEIVTKASHNPRQGWEMLPMLLGAAFAIIVGVLYLTSERDNPNPVTGPASGPASGPVTGHEVQSTGRPPQSR